MTIVEIDGTYECGHEYNRLVEVRDPRPGEDINDWWDDAVYDETGDDHTEDEGVCTTAKIKACTSSPELVGAANEWVTG